MGIEKGEDSDEEEKNLLITKSKSIAGKFGKAIERFKKGRVFNNREEFDIQKDITVKQNGGGQIESISNHAENYIRYNFKMSNYECEFYHFDFMRIVQILQAYLNEPTCQDIIKAYK